MSEPLALPIVGPATPLTPPTPMQLMQRALEAGNLDLVERMMTLQERWEASSARKAFEAAMAAARLKLPVILKTQSGPNGSYVYEDLATIARAIDPVLAEHHLSYRFRTKTDDKRLTVTCIISHELGHTEENSLSAAVSPSSRMMNDIQAIGSAQTYLQRYTLKAALGLSAGRDDDAAVSRVTNGNGGDTGEVIAAEQVDMLTKALSFSDTKEEDFLKRYNGHYKLGAKSLADIRAAHFALCLKSLGGASNGTAHA